MIAIYQSTIDEIKKVWKVCGYDISDQEIFDMFEEVERDDE
jgi:Ca2+-binding EF-hand superfamily protein